MSKLNFVIPACALLAGAHFIMGANMAASTTAETWVFDRLDSIGGHPASVLGHPKVVETPIGKAVQFNGVDDAIFVEDHPLAGAEAFTWEIIFRPDGGVEEQRFFHLAERDPQTKKDTDNRMLMEIRVLGDKWCLDSFAVTGKDSKALMDRSRLYPVGKFYHVAAVYDGKTFSNYVNGVLQGSGELHLAPQGQGHSSIGVRINRVNYFKGAVREARMSRRALKPEEFLKAPR